MKAFIAPRQAGKTEAILNWVREAPEGEHRICVTFSAEESMRLLRADREAGGMLESWQFVCGTEVTPSAWSAVRRFRGGRIVLGYDNVDLLLNRILPFEVGAISLTADDEPEDLADVTS